jgi:hypothetical protein
MICYQAASALITRGQLRVFLGRRNLARGVEPAAQSLMPRQYAKYVTTAGAIIKAHRP